MPNISQGDVTIDVIHQHIHDGNLFSIDTYNGSLGSNAFIDLLAVTSSITHLRYIAGCGGDGLITIYEDTTSVPASPEDVLPSINRNRIRAAKVTSSILVYRNPVLSSPLGILIAGPVFVPGGHGGSAPGAQSEGWGEFILKPNSNYLFRIQNVSGVADDFGVQLDFYE